MPQLSALDGFFVHGDTSRQAMNLSGVGIYDPVTAPRGKVTFADVRRYAAERTRRSALFRRMLLHTPFGCDQPYWTLDGAFDSANHLFSSALPAPGGRAELDEEIARIHARRVDRGHPLWEWWFIDGVDSLEGVAPGSFALLFKLHHAAFDGVSAWEVISVSHDASPNEAERVMMENELPAGARMAGSPPSLLKMGLSAYQRWLTQPIRYWDAMISGRPMLEKLVKDDWQNFPLAAGRAPATPFGVPVSARRVHRKVAITLEALKRVRALAPGATVNDAVLAIIGGALRIYLASRGALPAEPLNVGVPVSIRAKGAEGDAGNQAIMAITSIGTDVADGRERLVKIRDAMALKKDYVADIPAHLLTEMLEFVPGNLMDLAVRAYTGLGIAKHVKLPYNLIVTNVPASRTPIYFAGAKMVQYDASGPIWDGAALLHVVTSYLDTLNISFDAASNALPDPDAYVSAIERSIAELSDARPMTPAVLEDRRASLGSAARRPSRKRAPPPPSDGR